MIIKKKIASTFEAQECRCDYCSELLSILQFDRTIRYITTDRIIALNVQDIYGNQISHYVFCNKICYMKWLTESDNIEILLCNDVDSAKI